MSRCGHYRDTHRDCKSEQTTNSWRAIGDLAQEAVRRIEAIRSSEGAG